MEFKRAAQLVNLSQQCFPGFPARLIGGNDIIVEAVDGQNAMIGFVIVHPVVYESGGEFHDWRGYPSSVQQAKQFDIDRAEYEITDVCVGTGSRGQGIGNTLMTDAIHAISKQHHAYFKGKPAIISLQVFKSNTAAYLLYVKHGFKVVREAPTQNPFTGKIDADVFLQRKVF